MTHIPSDDLLSELEAMNEDSVRVLDTESLTVGLKRYRETTAGQKGSRKHTQDELYYVLTGAGTIMVGEKTYSVAAGDLLSVEEGVSHDIVEVDEELIVLKVFADSDTSTERPG
ncbi:cupin domain-containing protein [Natronolimnohabitans sp. A-GB9]|uniref:cupin domain-containing protein n=1 Tax=Natronolimnohabitans sp. A-GB9 TaxID=3069757 RepID=UPI0027AFFAE8|nr:cupin domain-containing protein [Natronolimnohabitans sp. A-GB9]MDQ2052246.1 cupin domain-containing protein [Natronolimnohabitans sp. A-GB9]